MVCSEVIVILDINNLTQPLLVCGLMPDQLKPLGSLCDVILTFLTIDYDLFRLDSLTQLAWGQSLVPLHGNICRKNALV